MRDEDTSDVLLFLGQIRDVRDYIIDTVHIGVGELDTSIYDEDVVLVFDDGGVDSDLIQTSERDDSDRNLVLLDQLGRILHFHVLHFVSMTQKC